MSDEYDLLLNHVKGISKDKLKDINVTTPLFKDKILDSMNILDLIAYIQKKIGRKLDDNEIVMNNFKDIKTIVDKYEELYQHLIHGSPYNIVFTG